MLIKMTKCCVLWEMCGHRLIYTCKYMYLTIDYFVNCHFESKPKQVQSATAHSRSLSSIHPLPLSRVLSSNIFQPLLGHPKVFPGRTRYIIHPTSSRSSTGRLPKWVYLEDLQKETSQRTTSKMSKPPQLARSSAAARIRNLSLSVTMESSRPEVGFGTWTGKLRASP